VVMTDMRASAVVVVLVIVRPFEVGTSGVPIDRVGDGPNANTHSKVECVLARLYRQKAAERSRYSVPRHVAISYSSQGHPVWGVVVGAVIVVVVVYFLQGNMDGPCVHRADLGAAIRMLVTVVVVVVVTSSEVGRRPLEPSRSAHRDTTARVVLGISNGMEATQHRSASARETFGIIMAGKTGAYPGREISGSRTAVVVAVGRVASVASTRVV
jgi:hypothetical protein